MKKLNIKVLSLFVAIAGIFAGCSQEELVKSDIDNATYPNAEIELSEITLVNVGTTTTDLSFDVKGYNPGILEIAVDLCRTDGRTAVPADSDDWVRRMTKNLVILGRVDFPAPEAPTRPIISPCFTVRLMPSTTGS